MSENVRLARRDDVPRLIALIAQLSLEGERRERDPRDPVYLAAFDAITVDPRQRIYALEDGLSVIGTGTLVILPNLSHGGRPIAQLESVVIDAERRGRGYGERLVTFLVDEARAAGCFRVQLTSNLARTEAHRFYERLGFVHSHAGMKRAL